MKYFVEKKTGTPAYIQLYTQLRTDIVSGVLPAGSRLPSKRQIAEELGIAVLTVEHAYALLAEEGYVVSRERRGYFVLYREAEPFTPPTVALPLTVPTRSDARPDFPLSVLRRTMRKVIADCGDALLLRSPNTGCPALREAIGRYLARSRGIYVRPEQIVVGSGAEYLYSLVVQLVGRDTIFALEDPSYDKIRRVYEAGGVRCEMLPLRSDGIDSAALRQTAAGVLHVTPFHSFPSGVTASAYKRREYVRWAEERSALIVEDDFDSEFTVSSKAVDTVFSLEPHRHVIYMNTFSKSIGPSIRVGYMVLPEAQLENYARRAGFYACTVPVFDQLVIAELLNSGDFERHINRSRRRLRREGQA